MSIYIWKYKEGQSKLCTTQADLDKCAAWFNNPLDLPEGEEVVVEPDPQPVPEPVVEAPVEVSEPVVEDVLEPEKAK